MLVDLNGMQEESFIGFKGGTKSFSQKAFVDIDNDNKMLIGRLEPGASIGYHKHEGNCEIMYILSGEGLMKSDDEADTKVVPGQCFYCQNGHSHNLINTGDSDLLFFAGIPSQK